MSDRREGSASIDQPDYWWYRARADLLHAALGDFATDTTRVLDVGSADGPSVPWLRGRPPRHRRPRSAGPAAG